MDDFRRNDGVASADSNSTPRFAGSREGVFAPDRTPLSVVGAREHNLRGVDVDIPANKLTAIAGPSGSGKSSLVFDVVYAEGQRQYVESLSVYSRQFLHRLERPDVESVAGLQPTVAIDRRVGAPNPRSIVATVAEIYDFLRLLYSRVGVARCWRCGRPIQRQTVEQIAAEILKLPKNVRFMLLAPVVREKKGACKDAFRRLIKVGFTRARVDGSIVEIASAPELDPKKTHTIEAIVDRLILRDGVEARLLESLKLALREGEGLVVCLYEKERRTTEQGTTRSVWKSVLYSERYSCPKCGVSYSELEPRTFSFNSPYGACPTCQGVGKVDAFDPDLLVSTPEETLERGALALGKGLSTATRRKVAALLATFAEIRPETAAKPLQDWDADERKFFFYGANADAKSTEIFSDVPDETGSNGADAEADAATLAARRVAAKSKAGVATSLLTDPERPILDKDRELLTLLSAARKANEAPADDSTANSDADAEPSSDSTEGPRDERNKSLDKSEKDSFAGLIPTLETAFAVARSKREREYLATYRGEIVCNDCGGARLRREARSVEVGGKNIREATALSIDAAFDWFGALQFDGAAREIAEPIVEQILERLRTMRRIGLGYLTLDRGADTLSGGELQRVRMTTGIGNGLSGVCYLLDEPSTGLHPRDNEKLLAALRDLQSRDNTVVVVEHNEEIIERADWLIDVGPGAGAFGGKILAEGKPADVAAASVSPTGRVLNGVARIPVPERRRKIGKTRSLVVEGVTTNNLKNVTATIPLGAFVCVTGVSGSGKSSLFNETLVPALRRRLTGEGSAKRSTYKSLRGASRIDKLIQIDQSPIGRSPRSNPATYTGVFDEIRKVFANSRDAKRRGYKAGRFSFNVAGGRCEECQGQGVQKIEMHFLPDMLAVCPVCEGKRFNRQTLEVRYKGKSIADALDMSVDEARNFFDAFPTITRLLDALRQVGLGYLTLGQSSTTLSGGEAQRVKLATELARVETGNTMYVLDEPTCGLHTRDVKLLLEVLQRLVDAGNTAIVVEHSLDVMKCADWIIDLGPEGGVGGGEIIATGTPEEIAALENNETGRFLRRALQK